jgi:type I restriction enzyme S subunit
MKPWPRVKLGEVLTERREFPSSEDLLKGRIKIIEKIGFKEGQIQLRSESTTKTGMILIRPGDLVVSGINAAKGAIAIYDQGNEWPITATIHYGVYIPNKNLVDIKFLWLLLRSRFFQELLLEYVPGGIKTELKSKRLLPVPIPLPSLSEQRNLLIKIENFISKIYEARALRREAVEAAEALKASYVYNLFINNKRTGWSNGVIGDYVIDDCYGTSEKTSDDNGGIPILRMGNIQNGSLALRELKYLYLLKKDKEKLLLKHGDILVNRTNSAELVGKCAVFNLEGEFGFASYIIRIRLDQSYANSYLVAAYINSPIGRSYMLSEKKQMTGQANVNSKKIKALPILLPEPSAQHRIVAELDALQAQVDRLKKLQAETEEEFDALMPSILDRAFKGELV